jgi:uncharacterized membrane protein YczE
MRKLYTLIYAVILNAFSQSLMAETKVGMTAWGVAAVNMEGYTRISLGMSFIILSVFAYLLAVVIRRKFNPKEMVESFLFLFAFGFLTDLFIILIPSLDGLSYLTRVLLNTVGLFTLLFSISIHLKVNRAIHPMDVYLKELQFKIKSVKWGTYLAYSSAFSIGIIFGLLKGSISAIDIGTLNVLLFSGLIFDFYTNKLLKNVTFEG